MIIDDEYFGRLKKKGEEVRLGRADARPFLPIESAVLVLQVEEHRRELEGWARLLNEVSDALGATDDEGVLDAARRVVRERDEARGAGR